MTDNRNLRIKAIIVFILSILLSLWDIRSRLANINILPLLGLLLAFSITIYFVYKNNSTAMVVLVLYETLDTFTQVFIQQHPPILPIIIWWLIVFNLWNALLINRGNKKLEKISKK